MLTLSPSSIKLWQACNAKWNYHYNLFNDREKQEKTEYLSLGSVVHEALDTYWKTRNPDYAAKEAFLKLKEPWLKIQGEILLLGYHEVYRNDGFTLVESEVDVKAEIKGLCELVGILDKIAIDPAGRKCIVEHKTTRSEIIPGSAYWLSRDLDTQVDIYYYLADQLELDIEYVLYDVIRVPQLRRSKGTPTDKLEYYKRGPKKGQLKPHKKEETWNDYRIRYAEYVGKNKSSTFVRQPMYRTASDLARTEKDVYALVKQIEFSKRENLFPRNMSSCNMYNTECEFKSLCTGGE